MTPKLNPPSKMLGNIPYLSTKGTLEHSRLTDSNSRRRETLLFSFLFFPFLFYSVIFLYDEED